MLPYHGDLQQVHATLHLHEADLEMALKSLFKKDKRYDHIMRMAGRLLIPEAFPNVTGQALQNGLSFFNADKEGNLLGITTEQSDLERISIDEQGHVQYRKSRTIKTSPLMILTQKGIDDQAKDQLSPYYDSALNVYLHEFCHFINYSIQKVPMSAVMGVVLQELRKRGFKETDADDKNKLFNAGLEKRAQEPFSIFHTLLGWEEMNAIGIHSEIYRRVGMPNTWETMMGEFYQLPGLGSTLDSLRKELAAGKPDFIVNWDKRLRGTFEYKQNFYDSLRQNVQVKRLPINYCMER